MDVLPSLAVLAAYAVAVVALTLTPGPDMSFFLGRAVTAGRAAGIAAMLGAATGLLVHTLLVALGLSALLAASASAFLVLKVAGAIYLAWLAAEAVRHGSGLNLDGAGAARPERLSRVYLKGLAINLLNPKIIMFFVTFLPQFVSPGDPHASAKLVVLGVAFVVIAVPISIVMIAFAARLAGLLKRSPRVMRGIDWLFAAVMGGFAVRLLLTRAA
jgi:threonine/homoserine/homoserine lactone efflux protein